MAHSRVSRFPGLADAEEWPVDRKLARIYADFVHWCHRLGIERIQSYEEWKSKDSSFKLAGV